MGWPGQASAGLWQARLCQARPWARPRGPAGNCVDLGGGWSFRRPLPCYLRPFYWYRRVGSALRCTGPGRHIPVLLRRGQERGAAPPLVIDSPFAGFTTLIRVPRSAARTAKPSSNWRPCAAHRVGHPGPGPGQREGGSARKTQGAMRSNLLQVRVCLRGGGGGPASARPRPPLASQRRQPRSPVEPPARRASGSRVYCKASASRRATAPQRRRPPGSSPARLELNPRGLEWPRRPALLRALAEALAAPRPPGHVNPRGADRRARTQGTDARWSQPRNNGGGRKRPRRYPARATIRSSITRKPAEEDAPCLQGLFQEWTFAAIKTASLRAALLHLGPATARTR